MRKLKRFAQKRKVLLLRAAVILVPLVFVMVLLSQTAFAKNTYVITDGSRVFTYTTYATDPAQVLGEAGLELDENDTYTTQAGLTGSSITVQRSQDITIIYYGEEMHVSSFGETVEALLNRMNISLGADDVVSQPMDTDTYDGMELRVEQVLHLEQTYTGVIAHEISYCYDSTLPAGSETVLTRGVDGETLCSATVTYVNGRETGRVVNSETVTAAPVTEIIAIGTAQGTIVDPNAMPIIGENTITLPTGEVLTYTDTMQVGATAYYCEPWERGITYSGTKARVGEIAVDPSVIPLGTRLFIISNDGEYIYGTAIAEDTGYLIDGNRIVLYFNTYTECVNFGYRMCTVYFLGSDS